MKYNNFLKTRNECRTIVTESEAFYCTRAEIEGYDVEMYDYRLASYTDFIDNEAFELRGLTFIYDVDNNEWVRHIALNKFFNINQTIGWMYEDVINKKIIAVADKRDGSLITFVKFPNGKIRAKSKMSFNSDQAKAAQKIYEEDLVLKEYINFMIRHELTPIFELTGPHNQIVLDYNNTELHLLQVRYNKNNDGITAGDYYSSESLQKASGTIKVTKQLRDDYCHLDTLLELKKTKEKIEGYVGMFEDGQLFKIKTDWYLQLHGLVTEGTRENLLIQTILDDNIDDVIAQLEPGEKREFILEQTKICTQKFNHLVVEFETLRRKYFAECNSARKTFAIAYSKQPMFSEVMKSIVNGINLDDIEETAKVAVKKHILKVTNSLNDAKEWLKQ
jgi:T4 RnlA family RNA ligase